MARRRSRSALTIIAVILGVSLLVGVNVASDSATREFTDHLLRVYGRIDILVSRGVQGPFNLTEVTHPLEGVEGIRWATPRLWWQGLVDNDSRGGTVGLGGVDQSLDFEFKNYNIDWLDGQRELGVGEVVVSKSLADKFGVGAGETLNLAVLNFTDLKPHTLRAFKVVGVYNPAQGTQAGFLVFMDLGQLQTLLGIEGKISQYLISLRDEQETAEVRVEIERRLGSDYDVAALKAEALGNLNANIQGFQLGLTTLTMVSLLITAFLVFNTFYMNVSERTYEIGVMRSQGSSRGQIFSAFITESILLGAVGVPSGVLAGLGLANLFTKLVESAFNFTITTFTLTPQALLLSVVAGFVTVVGGAFYPSLSASRISLVRALRPEMRVKGEDRAILLFAGGLILFALGSYSVLSIPPLFVIRSEGGVLPLDLFMMFIGAVLSVGISLKRTSPIFANLIKPASRSLAGMVSRNLQRKLSRTVVIMGIIAIALGFIVTVGGVEAGVVTAVEDGIREAFTVDILLAANQSLPSTFAYNLTSQFEEVVDFATPIGAVLQGTKLLYHNESRSVGVLVIDPSTFPKTANFEFGDQPPSEVYSRLASSPEALVIPKSLAETLEKKTGVEVKVGDKITLKTVTSDGRPAETNYTVAGVVSGAALQWIHIGRHPLSNSVVISFESQKSHFRGDDSALFFRVMIKPDHKPDGERVLKEIDAAYPRYGFEKQSSTLSGILSTTRSDIDRIFSILFVMLYFSIFISTLGVAIVMTVNVNERRREFGILRAQGMGRGQILSMLVAEASLIGLIGLVVGVPTGLILLKGTTGAQSIVGFHIPFVIPWGTILQALLLSVAAAITGAIYPAVKASRTTIIEALRQR